MTVTISNEEMKYNDNISNEEEEEGNNEGYAINVPMKESQ